MKEKTVRDLKEKIDDLYKAIQLLQASCKHPNVIVEHKGDTGNYDPSSDRYWDENRFPDCEKYWTSNERPAW